MTKAITKGFSFGLISGIITTLGLIVGLHSGTHLESVVLGGIFVIAVADAMSDAFGVHISEESQGESAKNVWIATLATFLTKFLFALTFAVPVVLLPLSSAIAASVIWGLSLIVIFSIWLSRSQRASAWQVVGEHLLIAILVIIITHFIGDLVATL